MTTKQDRAIKSAITREKKKGIVREEKHILWILVAIIIVLLYLLFAQHNSWWPFSQPKLGSAFYTNVSPAAPKQPAPSGDSNGTNGGSGGGSNTGSTTSPGSNGGGSTTSPPATGSDALTGLAATVNVGDTKTQVNGHANNLGSGCAVVVNANGSNVGKQEVCTYSQGDKIITITYLNDRVISASKSGF
jgi:hypothetical protein